MSDTLEHLIAAFLVEMWEEQPVAASQLGIDGYDDRLGEYSETAFARRDARTDHWIEAFSGVPDDGLTLDQRIDRDLILSQLRGARAMRDWMVWRRDPAQYLNPALAGVFILFLHRIRPEPELAAAAAARLEQVPAVLADGKRNLDPALASPLFVERAMGQCQAGVAYARSIVPGEVSDDESRRRLQGAGDVAAAAFEDYLGFLGDLKERARGHWAIGEARYSALLREKEMLGYGASEMREHGRAEYARLEEDLRRRSRDLDGTDNWRATIERLSSLHPRTPEEMRDAYERWTERARAFCAARKLVTLPEGERCLVEPSPPFQRPILAVASYNPPPAFKASLTGHFFVPYPPDGTPDDEVQKRLQTNSFHGIPTVSVHEAYPGHHWHLITTATNPRAARRVFWSPYFGEGWALYTERMMLEEGFYDDPRDEIFVGESRIFRAARIVVDTSLHMDDMSFEDAVEFMSTKTGLSEPTARAEVGRYCTWPTQASSYMTGALEIERMRARWLDEGHGDLRAFHDRIAASGALPIALAERAVFG